MANLIYTRRGAVEMAARMAADGDDTRHLAEEQSAYRDEIQQVTRLVCDDGMSAEEAFRQVLGE